MLATFVALSQGVVTWASGDHGVLVSWKLDCVDGDSQLLCPVAAPGAGTLRTHSPRDENTFQSQTHL